MKCSNCADMTRALDRVERHNRMLGFGFLEVASALEAFAGESDSARYVSEWARRQSAAARKVLKAIHDDNARQATERVRETRV